MFTRVTNNLSKNNMLRYITTNGNNMALASYQVATGKRIQKLSDDPVGILKSMRARVKLYRLDQYQKNIDTARTWLEQAETNVLELNDMIKSVYESTVMITNDTYSTMDKAAAAATIMQYRDHILDLCNGTESERYIFGGFNTTSKPFTVDTNGNLLLNGINLYDTSAANQLLIDDLNSQVMQIEIGVSVYSDATISGARFIGTGEENIYKIFDDLYRTLTGANSTFDDISPFITKLQEAQNRTLAISAELGGRTNRLDLVENRYADDQLTYKEMKSRVEDVDEAAAAMNLQMSKLVYQAALQAGAAIIQPTLLDYLR